MPVANQPGIAADFKRYLHRVPYRWGGATPRGWDCSGAVNYVLCHNLGYAIPGFRGGTFTGRTHGPSTLGWFGFPGMQSIGRTQVRAGDIVLWSSHMGIAVDQTQYISAFDTQLGTVIEPIHGGGPTGETASFWRLTEKAKGGSSGGGGGGVQGPPPGGGPNPTAGPQWTSMQNNWTALRDTLGPFGKRTFSQIDAIRARAKGLQRG
jgi:hypothetical protein